MSAEMVQSFCCCGAPTKPLSIRCAVKTAAEAELTVAEAELTAAEAEKRSFGGGNGLSFTDYKPHF